MLAVETANAVAAEILIAGGAALDRVDLDGCTAMMLTSDTSMIKLLLDSHASADQRGTVHSALSHACRSGRVDVARFLLGVGADANALNRDFTTPLMAAFAAPAPLPVVELLLDARARPDSSDRAGRSALHVAADPARCRDPAYMAAVVRLLRAGAARQVNSRDVAGETPLGRAVPALPLVETLIQARASVGADAGALLHRAVCEASPDVALVQLLLGTGAARGVDERDAATGRTPLMHAAARSAGPLVGALLRAKADVTVRDSKRRTALELAVEAEAPSVGIVRMLLDAAGPRTLDLINPSIGADAPSPAPPLLTAVAAGHLPLAQMLLQARADPDPATANGPSPLGAAAAYQPSAALAHLLGVKHCAPRSGPRDRVRVVEMRALEALSLQMVRLLLQHRADPDRRLPDGRTPLLAALHSEWPGVAAALINANADVGAKDARGDDAKTLAQALPDHPELSYALASLRSASPVASGQDLDLDPDMAILTAVEGRNAVLLEQLMECEQWTASQTGLDQGLAMIVEQTEPDDNENACRMARVLIDAGADVDHETEDGSLLRQCVSADNFGLAVLLVESGATVQEGLLTECIQFNPDPRLVRCLVDHKADVNEVSEGDRETPLLALCSDRDLSSSDRRALVKLLLDRKADVLAQEKHGGTPLSKALMGDSTKLVRMLLAAGADPCTKDMNGVMTLKSCLNQGSRLVHVVVDYADEHGRWAEQLKDVRTRLPRRPHGDDADDSDEDVHVDLRGLAADDGVGVLAGIFEKALKSAFKKTSKEKKR
jgi:ankyrin repeat protein